MFWNTNKDTHDKIRSLKETLSSSLTSLSLRMTELEKQIDQLSGLLETQNDRLKSLELEMAHKTKHGNQVNKIANEQFCVSMEIDDIKSMIDGIYNRLSNLESLSTQPEDARKEVATVTKRGKRESNTQ
jgi:predicted  nucleic acid-binding Zn-ribbon protein